MAGLRVGGRLIRYYSFSQLGMESHGLRGISSLTRADSFLQEGPLVITGILKLCPTGNVRSWYIPELFFASESPDELIKTQLATPLSQNF